MDRIKRIISSLLFGNKRKINDIEALAVLSKVPLNYLPWNTSSLRPSVIKKIINDIIINKRENVIEFGSGISTIYIAHILNEHGGHLYSVEHDKDWIDIVTQQLIKENLISKVTFIYAPLRQNKFGKLKWYSEKSLKQISNNIRFDLILIDGPPAYTKGLQLARYPALPYLVNKKNISNNCSIFLDDINRTGEKIILNRWEKEFVYKFKRFNIDGVAVCQHGKFYNI